MYEGSKKTRAFSNKQGLSIVEKRETLRMTAREYYVRVSLEETRSLLSREYFSLLRLPSNSTFWQ